MRHITAEKTYAFQTIEDGSNQKDRDRVPKGILENPTQISGVVSILFASVEGETVGASPTRLLETQQRIE